MKMVIEDRHIRRQCVACAISVHWLNLYAYMVYLIKSKRTMHVCACKLACP